MTSDIVLDHFPNKVELVVVKGRRGGRLDRATLSESSARHCRLTGMILIVSFRFARDVKLLYCFGRLCICIRHGKIKHEFRSMASATKGAEG